MPSLPSPAAETFTRLWHDLDRDGNVISCGAGRYELGELVRESHTALGPFDDRAQVLEDLKAGLDSQLTLW
jgi:hypothetical protein